MIVPLSTAFAVASSAGFSPNLPGTSSCNVWVSSCVSVNWVV
jgi:hypothetical protein